MDEIGNPQMAQFSGLVVHELDGVVTVTLDRVAARNAFDDALMHSLTEVARYLRRRASVRAVILAGHQAFFSAGVDLSAASQDRTGDSLLETRSALAAGADLCQAWEEIEAVTIAAIEGFCIGGACALALACDFRIMGHSAYLRLPEIPLGMNMSWRTLPRLVALIGPARTKQVVLFAEPVSARTCLDWGMADHTCADGEALGSAKAWAGKIAALPPIPVRMTKEAVNVAAYANAAAVSFMDRDQFLLATRTADFREGVAAFLSKRPGAFTGN